MICQKGSNLFNVAIYIRLSREDGDKEESDSVGNQRNFLTEYVNKHDDFILYDVILMTVLRERNFVEVDNDTFLQRVLSYLFFDCMLV